MLQFSTPAILIRRTEYGDYDLIVTFFSLTLGKVSLMAKAAKKSTRRFAGLLELFTELDIVGSVGRKSGLPVLQEATLRHPHPEIREAATKTAYASYWSELVNDWMEERVESAELFLLLRHVLDALAASGPPEAALSVLFQMRLLRISGHSPNLTRCVVCRLDLDSIRPEALGIEIAQGGIACPGCLALDRGAASPFQGYHQAVAVGRRRGPGPGGPDQVQPPGPSRKPGVSGELRALPPRPAAAQPEGAAPAARGAGTFVVRARCAVRCGTNPVFRGSGPFLAKGVGGI